MTSIIKVHVFSGARDDGPLCYLLQVDGDNILLDCGWDERFDTTYLEQLKPIVPKLSAVLLSHPDQAHLGALPYLVAKCGLTAPVYATVPVFKMGQMFLYDWVNSHLDVEKFEHFSLDDVDAAFEKVEQVKYNQTVLLKGDSGVHFTALPAGHMIGGAIWRICRVTGEDIVYCVDFNHKKERHLNACSFDTVNRPHLLITGAHHISMPQMRRKDRDEQLVTKILRTVKQKGDCLVVIDTAGRVLELAHLLDQLWANTDAGLSTYNLVMMSHVASSVVQFSKSQLEWMNDNLFKFDTGRYNPFTLRNVILCHSHIELMRVRSPKVVLCSNIDMQCGFSRELFLDWCSDARNGVILTCRPATFTLGAKLVNLAERSVDGRLSVEDRFMEVKVKKRVPLENEELHEFRRRKAERDAEEARLRLERVRRNVQVDEDSSDDSDEENEPMPASIARQSTTDRDIRRSTAAEAVVPEVTDSSNFDIMSRWEAQQKKSFFKSSKKTFPMYSFLEEKTKWDDYGEIIRPEEFMLASKFEESKPSVRDEDAQNGVKTEEEMEEKVVSVVEEQPTKCVEFTQQTEILCRVEFIEYEGISDGESTKRLLHALNPRQVIIIHGSSQDTRELCAYFRDNGLSGDQIEAPNVGQLVDASVESYIYQVALSDALLAEMTFHDAPDSNSLVWVDARVIEKESVEGLLADTVELTVADDDEENPTSDGVMETDQAEEEDSKEQLNKQHSLRERLRGNFMLEVLTSKEIPNHEAVYVNDPKLSEFKNVLVEKNYKAEFLSGSLIINSGQFSIRRCETGVFLMEGAFSRDYYALRDLFYDQFAVI